MDKLAIPPLFKHQAVTLKRYREHPQAVFDTSDPGTGKTRVNLDAFSERRAKGGGRMLLVAPNSLLMSAWGDDLARFVPWLRIKYCLAGKREQAFENEADIVALNTDGVRWFFEKRGRALVPTRLGERLLKGFDTLGVDESADFKHHTSTRSKCLGRLARRFEFIALLTGTAAPGSVAELWHQAFVLDGGKSLGDSFYRFRDQVQTPVRQSAFNANAVKWVDKPGIRQVVAPLLAHMTVRHRFADCVDIPAHRIRRVVYHPPPKLLRAYRELEATAKLRLKQGDLTAVNAAVLRGKLLQTASGAVYRSDKGHTDEYALLDGARYELVTQLVAEDPEPTVVFFCWRHQRVELEKALSKLGLDWAVMGSNLGPARRKALVDRFQDGGLRALLLHPATGAHGLTLTRGRRTVIPSPFDRADWLVQAKHRIWRAGQKNKTETILVEAAGTVERKVYGNLDGKVAGMEELFELFEEG